MVGLEGESREGEAKDLGNGTSFIYAAFLLLGHNCVLLINISFILHMHAAENGAYLGIKRLLITDPICTYEFPESYYRSDSLCPPPLQCWRLHLLLLTLSLCKCMIF